MIICFPFGEEKTFSLIIKINRRKAEIINYLHY
jgi:hypothetical protein